MPSSYQCFHCGLSFSLGWYHYHNFPEKNDVLYVASTLLVCRSCGVQHKLEHAAGASKFNILSAEPGPQIKPLDHERLAMHRNLEESRKAPPQKTESATRHNVWDEIRSTMRSLSILAEVPFFSLKVALWRAVTEKMGAAYPWVDQISLLAGISAKFSHLTCLHCGKRGTLVNKLPKKNAKTCPTCREAMVELLTSWRT